jgi:hypothetical protein
MQWSIAVVTIASHTIEVPFIYFHHLNITAMGVEGGPCRVDY